MMANQIVGSVLYCSMCHLWAKLSYGHHGVTYPQVYLEKKFELHLDTFIPQGANNFLFYLHLVR